jgi:hypothetical protein
LEKYCKQHIPVQSTLRKYYLPVCYEETLEKIRCNKGDALIRVAVDETTDSVGRFITNLVAGKLDIEVPSKPHLVCSKVLHHTNHSTVAKFVAYRSSRKEGANFVFRCCGIYAESVLP